MQAKLRCAALIAGALGLVAPANAAEVKVLTAGAFKQVVVALVPNYERQTGNHVTVDNGTTGELKKRIEGGEAFDIVVITPEVVDQMIASGKVAAGSQVKLASVGIGVVVKEGAPKPDISTADAFKHALLNAKSVGFTAAGASGAYLKSLFEKLGITEELQPKLKLLPGPAGAAVANGEVEVGMTQISEILPYANAELVGPLPAEIQSYTHFSAGISAANKDAAAASALIKFLTAPSAATVFKAKGMEQG